MPAPQPRPVDVVVVDDSHDAAEAMALALEMDGYVVRIAHGGHDALALIEACRPTCVLLDFEMPQLDGLELTLQLRRRYGDDIVLVAITGRSDENERVADTFARVDHHFMKPVSPEQIRRLLPPVS